DTVRALPFPDFAKNDQDLVRRAALVAARQEQDHHDNDADTGDQNQRPSSHVASELIHCVQFLSTQTVVSETTRVTRTGVPVSSVSAPSVIPSNVRRRLPTVMFTLPGLFGPKVR